MTASLEDALGVIDTEIRKLPNLIVGSTISEIVPHLELLKEQISELKKRSVATQPSDGEDAGETPADDDTGQLQMLAEIHHAIAALPNQIAGPTLDELFRTLLPLRDSVYYNGQTLTAIFEAVSALESGEPVARAADVPQAPADPLPNPSGEQLDKIAASLDAVQSSLNAQRFDHSQAFNGLETAALSRPVSQTKRKRPEPVADYDSDQVLQQVEDHKPDLYDTWKSLFDAAGGDYVAAPNRNCSTWTSAVARAFRSYVRLHCQGQMLDIGCGPYANPVYLQGLSADRLSAVEPLELVGEPRFPVYRAVNEFLPFEDKSFQTVVNATSLDHCIDLERALDETARVLDTGGVFILWYANVKGAVNPVTDFAGPADTYHLFHTDDDWFLPMLDMRFETIDRRVFPASENSDDVFAVYRKP